MKKIANYFFPVFLIILGGALLIVGALQHQGIPVLLGAGLALLAGLASLLLLLGVIGRRLGFVMGLLFAALAIGLAYHNYRSVAVRQHPDERDRSDLLAVGSPSPLPRADGSADYVDLLYTSAKSSHGSR